jgi:opacity protein-like surface antigen
MKPIIPVLALLSLGSSAFAGSESVAYQPPSSGVSTSVMTQPAWFAGGSVGYLIDSEEGLYTLHFGKTFAQAGPLSHSLYAEVGYSEMDDSPVDLEFIPLTLNYKLDYQFGGGFSFYAGAGLGAAFQDVEVFGASDDSVEFMAQAFAGIGYDISESFQIYGGARYIWIDDTELLGVSVDSGDDVALEIGARFRF